MALTRIAEGYVKALPSLRESGQGPMNLPYLAATPSEVVVHLQMILAPEPELPVPEPTKKHGWWPFGG